MMDKILEYFGGPAGLARALNVSPPAVSQWILAGREPAFRAIEIEVISYGKFKAVDMMKGAEE